MTRSSTIKVSAGIVLLLMIIFFAVISWCFFTEKGSRLSLDTLKGSLQNFDYQYESGNLAKGLQLSDVSWTLRNQTRISMDNISLKWNPMCWRGQEFCISHAQVNRLAVSLVDSKTKTNPIKLKSIKIPFTLITDELSIKSVAIEHPQRKPVELSNIEFAGTLTDSTITANSIHLDWQWFHVLATGEMTLTDNYPLALQGELRHLEHKEKFPVGGSFTLNGDLLHATLQSNLIQPFKSTIAGNVSFLTRKTPADLKIQWAQAQIPLHAQNPLLYLRKGDLRLTGYWPDYELKGTVESSGPKLPVAMTTLAGDINTKRLQFNSLLLNTMDGDIEAIGELRFGQGIEWRSALSINNIKPNRFWSIPKTTANGTATFNGRNNNGQTTLQLDQLDVKGNTGGFPFLLTGSIHRTADNAIQLNTVEILSHKNSLTVNGSLSEESDTSLFFSLRHPEMFYPGLKGDLNGDLRITGNKADPQVTGSATAGSLWYKNYRLTNTRLSGNLKTAEEEVSELVVTAQSATNGKHKVQDLNVRIHGSPENHYLQANFDGEPISVDSIRMSGTLDEHRNWSGKVYKTSADITGQPIELSTPFEMTWVHDKKSIALQPHCWTITASKACVEKPALIGKDGALEFSINQFDLNSIDALIPEHMSISGILQSYGNLQWHSFQRPKAELITSIRNGLITILPPTAKKPLTLALDPAQLTVTTKQNKITSTLTIDTDKTGPIDADVEVFLNNRRFPMRGELTLSDTDINWLDEYFPALKFDKGVVSGSVSLSGTLKNPSLNGQLQLQDASLNSPAIPVPLDNISMDVGFGTDTVTVDGNATSNGRPVTVNGTAHMENQQWQADLNFTGDKIQLKHKFLDSAVVSPALQVTLSQNSVSVGGRIKVPQASINLPKLENTGVPLSDDIVIVDAVAKDNPRLVTRTRHAIRADVDIVLGNDVTFKGYGLDADLYGNMNVKIKPKRIPELLGEIFIDSGTYRSYGQSLVIRDGRINFVGPLEQTTLSVEAVRNTGRVLAGLRVDGSLDEPQTTLFSEPPLPEEDILPYLVLGRPIDLGAASADDSQLIANAALFMGITNGRTLTRTLAENLGIDEFTMSATGSGEDTQVQLSGRLNDRLLVRYGLGVFNSVNTLFLRYDLAEKLYLETTQGLEKAVDLFYSFEFD